MAQIITTITPIVPTAIPTSNAETANVVSPIALTDRNATTTSPNPPKVNTLPQNSSLRDMTTLFLTTRFRHTDLATKRSSNSRTGRKGYFSPVAIVLNYSTPLSDPAEQPNTTLVGSCTKEYPTSKHLIHNLEIAAFKQTRFWDKYAI